MKYEVIDNFLPESIYNTIYSEMFNKYFPWFLYEGVNDEHSEEEKNDPFTFQFIHNFYDYSFPSNKFTLLEPLLKKLEASALSRVKANLLTPTQEIKEFGYHIDIHNFTGVTAVYYMNSNNGYTCLNKVKVESKANRLVVFNPDIRHYGTTCTNAKNRTLININFVPLRNSRFHYLV